MDINYIPLIGTLFDDRYLILSKLGQGGFGSVFHAQDRISERSVALKLFILSDDWKKANENSKKAILRGIEVEARAMGRLTHPHAVTLYTIDTICMNYGGRSWDVPYLVMEFVEGNSLDKELHKNGAMGQERAVGLVLNTLDVLSEAHKLGVVHKDLKPSNLILTRSKEGTEIMRVLDFGVARLLNDDRGKTKSGNRRYSAEYGAPEYVNDHKVSPALDVYQMGLILIEMLTGKAAVGNGEAGAMRILYLHYTGGWEIPDEVTKLDIYPCIRKATARSPEDRYPNAQSFKQALEDCGDEPPTLVVVQHIMGGEVVASDVEPVEISKAVESDGLPHDARPWILLIGVLSFILIAVAVVFGVGLFEGHEGEPEKTVSIAPASDLGLTVINKSDGDKGGPELALRGDGIPAPDIEGDTKEPPVKVETKPLAEHIWLISTPKGATLTIDGEKVDGKTPLRVYRPEEAGPTSVIVLKRRRLRGYLKIDWANNKTGDNVPVKLSRQNTTKKEDRNPVVADKGSNKGDDKGTNKGSDKGTNKGLDKGTNKGNDSGSKPSLFGPKKSKPKLLNQ